jgi:serralysin
MKGELVMIKLFSALICVSMLTIGCGGNSGGSSVSSNDVALKSVTLESDRDADGIIDYALTVEYDAQDRISQLIEGDGIVSYLYDANENIISAEFDESDDGSVDSIISYTYDANDNLVSWGFDNDDDGITDDSCHSFEYNANGQVIRQEIDDNCDGSIEDFVLYSWTTEGNIERTEEHFDSGFVRVEVYSYDSNGNLITQSTDYENDGLYDKVQSYVWNAGAVGTENFNNLEMIDSEGIVRPENMIQAYRMIQNLHSIETDRENDGSVDAVMYFYYDGNSNLIRFEYDEDNSGTVDEITHILWPSNF